MTKNTRGFLEALVGASIGGIVVIMLIMAVVFVRTSYQRATTPTPEPASGQMVEVLGGVPFGLQAAVVTLSNSERVMLICGSGANGNLTVTAVRLVEPPGFPTLPFPGSLEYQRQFKR